MKLKRKFFQRGGAAGNDMTVAAEDASSGALRRRALLTGGALVAGAVGTGAAMVGGASSASAATGDPVLQNEANTVSATTSVSTTLTASSTDASPTLVLGNQGSSGKDSAGDAYGSPALRLTQSVGMGPDPSTAGGDLLFTTDGNLWFTHEVPPPAGSNTPVIIPATVHTDATANYFVPLKAPVRILDTRSNRGKIINASGNLNSSYQLEAGKTIHIDLSSLVSYGTAVTANLTVTSPVAGGWVLIWPGSGTQPTSSSINFTTKQTIANLTVTGIDNGYASGSTAYTDTIAITASATTHVLLDVIGFNVGNAGQISKNNLPSSFGENVLAGAGSVQSTAVKRASAIRSLSQASWNQGTK